MPMEMEMDMDISHNIIKRRMMNAAAPVKEQHGLLRPSPWSDVVVAEKGPRPNLGKCATQAVSVFCWG